MNPVITKPTGKPRKSPEIRTKDVITFKARPRDLRVMEALEVKKGLDRTNVIRLALYHLAEFEGVQSTVAEKAALPDSGAVSSAG